MTTDVFDPSKTLRDSRLEYVARQVANRSKPIGPTELASLQGTSEKTAIRRLKHPQVIDRATFLMRYRLKGAIPKALSTLEELMDSKHDSVRLKAAIELLDRAGLQVETSSKPPAFTIELNLGGGFKTATSQRPPPQSEEFLGADKPPLQHEEFLPSDEGSPPMDNERQGKGH